MAMSATMDFLRPIHEFIKQSFDIEARGTVKSQYNLAVSYIKTQALQGEYPNISVDYSKVVLSFGTLPNPLSLGMKKKNDGLSFSWDSQMQEGAQPNDMAMILLYFPLRKQAIQLINPISRSASHYFIALDNQVLNEPIETYICFKSTDGNSISDSMYLGSLN